MAGRRLHGVRQGLGRRFAISRNAHASQPLVRRPLHAAVAASRAFIAIVAGVAEDFAYANDPEFSTIRRKLARWAADNVRIIKDLKPPQPPGFNNRLNANWKLLLQIAQHAGVGWFEQARRSAIYLSRVPYEPSAGVQLLAALRAMFTKNRREITSEQVVQELLADPNSPWHEYRGRGPITKNQVAALLKDFEIRPVVVHPTKRADLSRHGYRAAQFEDAFARFLPPEPNIRTLKRGGGEKT